MNKLILFAAAVASFLQTAMAEFNRDEAEVAVLLSQAAYCGKDEYMIHSWTGPLEGFVTKFVLYNE